ncbi:hypothetical protein [uncultured Sneathiella sp.]|uniref:hypothetical protein n=1 Tax=uncultured Sneathiella sp. TaxID=879315 RepID=UPI0030EECFCC|tara:strand:- start:4905 stop:6035 length:1131 start_codon:yes stop_codon:yes gene_type:complete
MSDKHNENDENEEEYKENTFASSSDFTKYSSFQENAARIYDIIFEIYTQNKAEIFTTDFDLYGSFLELFQPSVDYDIEIKNKKIITNDSSEYSVDLIKREVINVYEKYKCKSYPLIKNENSTYFGRDDLNVYGILYFALQNKISVYNDVAIYDKKAFSPISGQDFIDGNAYFRISSPRPYKKARGQPTLGRIAIHLKQSPIDFWVSPTLKNMMDLLINQKFVKALKVRQACDFGRGDSLLIYCNIPATEAWKMVGQSIIDVIPAEVREKYRMPFATSLDVGINANIPIFCGTGDNLEKTSFTMGLAHIARQALGESLKDNQFHMHGIYDVKMKTQEIRKANIDVFQKYLANGFMLSGLAVDKKGALYQELEIAPVK